MLKLYHLTVEYLQKCTLAPVKNTRFGWKLLSSDKNVFQKSFSLTVFANEKQIFSSGEIQSDKSFNVTFNDLLLPFDCDCLFTVTVTDNYGNIATESLQFTTAPDNVFEGAKWISPAKYIDGASPYIRGKFIAKKVKRATLYASGLGYAYYYLNGKEICDYLIDPPQTNYQKQIFYRSYDITEFIKEGGNAFVAQLGQGFYSQDRAWKTYPKTRYGKECFIGCIKLEYENGVEYIKTNTKDWKYIYSPVILNNVYGGEIYDARFEVDNFALYGGDDDGFMKVVEDVTPKGKLIPCNIPPVRVIKEIKAKSIKHANGVRDGAWIIDIGENIAGVVEIKIPRSPVGATYVLRYAETLDQLGKLDFRSTGAYANQMIQQDIYIAKGVDGETYRPKFTYHGFRYVEITGIHDLTDKYGTVPKANMLTAYAISSDVQKTCEFNTSNEYLSKFNQIIDRTVRSNLHGVPTDCPVRERCGWMGDAQINCNLLLSCYDTQAIYQKYYNDIITSKEVNGYVTNISPGMRTNRQAFPNYGASVVVIAYWLYKYYGDTQTVTENFKHIQEWVEEIKSRSVNYIVDQGLGDWDPPVEQDSPRRMPKSHAATFTFYEVCLMTAELCFNLSLGDGNYYLDLAKKVKDAVIENFYNHENHTYGYWASNGGALHLGLYPDGEKQALLDATANLMEKDNYAMCTGLYGNKYLPWALFENNCADLAFSYLFNKNAPSLATIIDDGATTVWEEINQGASNAEDVYVLSYNHVMHGSFAFTLYSAFAGITPVDVGYKKIEFKPCKSQYVKDFTARLQTVTGEYVVKCDGESFTLTVPANATAILPNGKQVGSGEYKI